MKHIYVNFKRFEVPAILGGVNRIAPIGEYAETIVNAVKNEISKYNDVEFVHFYPESHLLAATKAAEGSLLKIGSQSVYRKDVGSDGNFGAFTSCRPATAVKALGCTNTLIGHCEERRDLAELFLLAGSEDRTLVNRVMHEEILRAQEQGLDVLYCIGEKDSELALWDTVLQEQLSIVLEGVDLSKISIAYEPVWSIGPGKTPADKPYITKVARFVKDFLGDVPVVYGGGLKSSNAEMLASIPEIDGGLIALTRFHGEIGFYPQEYLEIIDLYLTGDEKK